MELKDRVMWERTEGAPLEGPSNDYFIGIVEIIMERLITVDLLGHVTFEVSFLPGN